MTRNDLNEIPKAPATKELDQLIAWRREFHRYPEIRWTEFWTSARIIEILEYLGFEVLYGKELYELLDASGVSSRGLRKYVPDDEVMGEAYAKAGERLGDENRIAPMRGGLTGVVARISGKAAVKSEGGNEKIRGQRFGFRVDIDGLPMMGSEESDHVPYQEGFASQNGNAHACGHDGHIAIGLGLAKRIRENIDTLGGEYVLIFQPGEEGGMGGEVFSNLPFLKDMDHFATVHLGLIGGRKLSCGLTFMDANAYSVEFRGKSTHSAVAPEEGRNALLSACSAVMNLYAIPRHGDGASRVNVGEFHSHNAMNIISDRTTFTYQTRGESPFIAEYMDQQAKRILRTAAQMHNVEVNIREEGKYISSPNDPEMRQAIRDVGTRLGIKEQAILEEFKLPGSEDAPYLMRTVQSGGGKATFIGLGCDTRGGHHNPGFDFDEDLLYWGVELFWEFIKGLSD